MDSCQGTGRFQGSHLLQMLQCCAVTNSLGCSTRPELTTCCSVQLCEAYEISNEVAEKAIRYVQTVSVPVALPLNLTASGPYSCTGVHTYKIQYTYTDIHNIPSYNHLLCLCSKRKQEVNSLFEADGPATITWFYQVLSLIVKYAVTRVGVLLQQPSLGKLLTPRVLSDVS